MTAAGCQIRLIPRRTRHAHPAQLLAAVSLFTLTLSPAPAAPPDKDGLPVVVVEGTGKTEKEAQKAAFREAVARVVGTLVDAETLVKNDEVITDKILEFSGGFIKTFETLKSDKTTDGLVRVKIKATVERLQIAGKLQDAKISTKEVKGTDLLAEKMTKEEARKNATELLLKLYEDLPKLAKAEVVGKPSWPTTARAWSWMWRCRSTRRRTPSSLRGRPGC